jgi:hypothetical protein
VCRLPAVATRAVSANPAAATTASTRAAQLRDRRRLHEHDLGRRFLDRHGRRHRLPVHRPQQPEQRRVKGERDDEPAHASIVPWPRATHAHGR